MVATDKAMLGIMISHLSIINFNSYPTVLLALANNVAMVMMEIF